MVAIASWVCKQSGAKSGRIKQFCFPFDRQIPLKTRFCFDSFVSFLAKVSRKRLQDYNFETTHKTTMNWHLKFRFPETSGQGAGASASGPYPSAWGWWYWKALAAAAAAGVRSQWSPRPVGKPLGPWWIKPKDMVMLMQHWDFRVWCEKLVTQSDYR